MKKMSKLLSGAFALALVACMGTTAFAAEITDVDSNNQAKADVTVTATEKVLADDVYSVTITIPDLTFTYSFGEEGNWNVESLEYENTKEAGWSEASKTINLVNKSNVGVTVTGSYTAEVGYDSISGEFTQDSVNLPEADTNGTTAAGEEQTDSMTFTIDGEPDSELSSVKVGTVTLTVTKTGA